MRDLNTFFLNIHQKWKYYRKENQDFKRFLKYILILKCQQNLEKIELSEEFIAMCRVEQSLWDVMSPLY